jgi:c-di-GMP-binding flagellar brake protein YcgR
MSALPELLVNTRVEIEVEAAEYAGKYFSRVMDINRRELRIMSPAVQGVPIPLRVNTPIWISYVGERALYSFKTVIKQRFSDVLAGFVVEIPDQVDRVQRRNYVRLEVQIHFRYRILQEANILDTEIDPETFDKSYIVDISGGGVRFYSDQPVTQNSLLEMQIGIEGIEAETLLGRVARNRERVEGGYEIGVAFEGVSALVQDQIISWIFNKQRELRRMGLA